MTMQGNTILVAGGTRGIGRGLAELLCRLGNEVILFGSEPGAAQAIARTNPRMRAIDLDLANPWGVASFCEQVAANLPGLNMLVNISIAFPVRDLPGLHALLDDDDSGEQLEAHQLGMQQLTGALLPHFRKRAHSSILNVAAGPALALPNARRGGRMEGLANATGLPGCTMSVRKRWASACIEVIDVALPSRAQRVSPDHSPPSPGMPRAEFVSSVAHLLAEGLHEAAALSRLQALWPRAKPAERKTRDDDLVSEVY
jgi:uncharacterized oxidoreductase